MSADDTPRPNTGSDAGTATGTGRDAASAPALPPPAFPPGVRRRTAPRAGASAAAPTSDDALAGAMISPDEPIPTRDGDAGALRGAGDGGVEGAASREQAVATGMDHDAHVSAPPPPRDTHVEALADRLGRLSRALARVGEGALRSGPDQDRFDVTLRAYCRGWLDGRRGAANAADDE